MECDALVFLFLVLFVCLVGWFSFLFLMKIVYTSSIHIHSKMMTIVKLSNVTSPHTFTLCVCVGDEST